MDCEQETTLFSSKDNRCKGPLSLPKNHLKYSYIKKKLISDTSKDDLPEHQFDDLVVSQWTTYSLNKKGRWNMIDEFRSNLHNQNDNPEELRISVLEQHLFHPTNETLSAGQQRANIGTVAYHCTGDNSDQEVIHKYSKKKYANEKSLTDKPNPPKKRAGKGRRRGLITNNDHLINNNNNDDDNEMTTNDQQQQHHIRYEIITQSPGVGIYEKVKRLNSRFHDDMYVRKLSVNKQRSLQRIARTSYEDWELDGHVIIEEDYWQDVMNAIDDDITSSNLNKDCATVSDNDHSATASNNGHSIGDFIANSNGRTVKREKRKKRNSNSSSSEDKNNRILIQLDDDEESDDSSSFVDIIQIAPQNIVLPVSRPENTLLTNFAMKPVTTTCATEGLNPENLKLSHGCTYYECACLPRRFCIDISGQVRTALIAHHLNGSAFDIQAICIFEIVPNFIQYPPSDKITVLNVWVNGIFANHVQSLTLNTFNPCQMQTVDSIIEAAVKMFTMLPYDCFELKPSDGPVSVNIQYDAPSRLLHDISFRCVQMSEASEIVMQREELTKKLQRQITVARSYDWDSYDCELTCGICCVWLSTDFNPGFCLAECQHWFCKLCWQTYCSDRIRNGLIPVKCPESGCNTLVDHDVLTTMLPLTQCVLFSTQYRDRTLLANSDNWMWCPNNKCGRIVFAEGIRLLNVCSCVCGEIWCARCNSAVHWPVNCEDAKSYMEKLKKEGDLQKTVNYGKIRFVEVKKCPHCKLQMEKGEGCHFMSCRCGGTFCWDCNRKWEDGTHGSCTSANQSSFNKVKLVDYKKPNEPDFYSDHLYERCVAHRRAVLPTRLWDIKQQLFTAIKSYKYLKTKLARATHWGATIQDNVSTDYLSTSNLTSQIDVIQRFTASFFEVYYQYHYILEYTYLWLQSAFYQKKDRTIARRIYSLTDRLTFITSILEDALASGNLDKLIDTIPSIRNLLNILVKELTASVKHE